MKRITCFVALLFFIPLGVLSQDLYMPIYRFMMEDNHTEAHKLIADGLQHNPHDGTLLQLQGDVYVQQLRYDEAVKCYAKRLEGDPVSTQALDALADCYLRQGMFAKSVELAEQLYLADTTNRRSTYKYAASLIAAGKSKAAIPLLELLTAQDTASLLYLKNLGDCYTRDRRYAEAEQCYVKALEQNRQNVSLYHYLANIFYNQNKFDQAADYATSGLLVDSTSTDLLKMLGFCSFKTDKYEDAIRVFRKAYELGDSSAVVSKYLGISLSRHGTQNFDECLYHLERSYNADTLNLETLFYFAKELTSTYRKPEAKRHIEKAIELQQPNPELLSQSYEINAWIHRNMSKHKEGYELYAKAYELNKENKILLFNMAAAQKDMKNYEKALQLYQLFLKELNEPEEKEESKSLRIQLLAPNAARREIKLLKEELFFEGKLNK